MENFDIIVYIIFLSGVIRIWETNRQRIAFHNISNDMKLFKYE